MTKEQLDAEIAAVRAARNEALARVHDLEVTERVLLSLLQAFPPPERPANGAESP